MDILKDIENMSTEFSKKWHGTLVVTREV